MKLLLDQSEQLSDNTTAGSHSPSKIDTGEESSEYIFINRRHLKMLNKIQEFAFQELLTQVNEPSQT